MQGAGDITDDTARCQSLGGLVQDSGLQTGKGSYILGRAPPFGVRPAAEYTQAGAGRIHENSIRSAPQGGGVRQPNV